MIKTLESLESPLLFTFDMVKDRVEQKTRPLTLRQKLVVKSIQQERALCRADDLFVEASTRREGEMVSSVAEQLLLRVCGGVMVRHKNGRVSILASPYRHIEHPRPGKSQR